VVLAIVLAVGVASAALMLVLMLFLLRHLKLLSASLRRFRDDVGGLSDEIRATSLRAQARLESIPGRRPR
jgi:hypothetical protein